MNDIIKRVEALSGCDFESMDNDSKLGWVNHIMSLKVVESEK